MRHTISILVENKFGVLTRVAGMFSGRGFNIDSLNVGPTLDPSASRMTIVVRGDDKILEQVTKQLNKLINVIKIVELEPDQAVQRDHMLIKVKTDSSTRGQVLEAVNLFRARVIDVVSDAIIIEVTGDTSKCQALLKVLEPFGIKELVQSGVLAMGRGSKSITEKVSK